MADSLTPLQTLFQALADRTRLRILALLSRGEVCVCHLHETLGEPQPKVSRHLAYLRRAGLVETRRDGLWVHYRLAQATDPVIRTVQDVVAHALGHVTTLQRDVKKLAGRRPVADERRVSGRPEAAAVSTPVPGCACCAPVDALVPLTLRRR